MDLLLKVGILIFILVALIGIAFLAFVHPSATGPITQAQAEQLVLNDVKASSPNATVSVISVSPSILENNSWDAVLSVVYNGTRPCPTLIIQEFDYPATGLQPSTDVNYTTRCVVYGLSTAPSYVISSPEIAIARSYNTMTPVLLNFVTDYGYKNVNVYAAFYSNITANATPLGVPFSNSWIVNYTSAHANYNQYVVLGQSGQILGNYTITKP